MTDDTMDTRYLFRLTDDTGMFQHAVLGVPDPKEGYTTDDNARALVLAGMLYARTGERKYEDLLVRYLSFLVYAEKDRWFRNFMGYDRDFLEKRGSEDCFGRCLWTLAWTAVQKRLPGSVRVCAERLLRRTVPSCSSLSCLKSKAYALSGLLTWGDPSAQPFAKMMTDFIVDTYAQCRREDWRWFEDKVTYCNGILPYSMLCAGEMEKRCRKIGLESLDFLLESTIREGMFRPVGCKGWFPRGGKPAEYDEQPVEACSTMLACLKACRLTGSRKYSDAARRCFAWYVGRNSLGQTLIDPETGGCCDGLKRGGLNRNQGAESIVCWLIARTVAEEERWLPLSEKEEEK